MKDMKYSLRALARLLSYPDAEWREQAVALVDAIESEKTLPSARVAELRTLVSAMLCGDPMEIESRYVETFDRGRATSLHLFEHVHGDSRDRGPAMIDLLQTYEQAGLYLAPGELPDHLTVVLEYASTQPPAQARAFLRELTHILQAIFSALLRRESPYASVLAAVLELAGEKAQAVKIPDEPTLDESWEEPAAFGGCSTQGQASPGQPQPIQIVRAAARQASTQPGASA